MSVRGASLAGVGLEMWIDGAVGCAGLSSPRPMEPPMAPAPMMETFIMMVLLWFGCDIESKDRIILAECQIKERRTVLRQEYGSTIFRTGAREDDIFELCVAIVVTFWGL